MQRSDIRGARDHDHDALSSNEETSRFAQKARLAALWIAPAVALTYVLTLASNHVVSLTPDGATVLLEGQSISTGNLGLQGWSLSLDSFWGIDAAFYALAVRVAGIRSDLLHIVPALLAALLVIAAVAIARRDQSGLARFLAGATVFVLLALPSPDLAYFLLQGPWHIGTTLYCLVAFHLLTRPVTRTWWRYGRWAVAVALLAVGLLSDLLMLVYGVLPCLAAGILAMWRARRLRAGAALVGGALASIVGAIVLRLLAQVAGTFTLVNRNLVVNSRVISHNIHFLANRLLGLFGVGQIPLGQLSNGSLAYQLARLIGLVLVVGGVGIALFRLARDVISPKQASADHSAQLDNILLIGVLADAVFFIFGASGSRSEFAKYLTAGTVFGVVLAARQAHLVVGRARSRAASRIVLCVGALLGAIFATQFVSGLFRPLPPPNTSALNSFLVAHHLTEGIGDYWSSSLVTVGTEGAVTVRPVITNAAGHLVRFDRQSSLSWYEVPKFQFFVYDTSRPWHGVNTNSAKATYGPPTRTYVVGTYRVLVFTHGVQVALGASPKGSPLRIFLRDEMHASSTAEAR